ncbi:LysR family transcriptional regulator [Pelagibacterium luteolum]|uniref:LysR family transcriptional regulator, nitrogen assimilation regulatory protein n=1 Tax=Pelagibacterium luteolum TaxID=440168 RepID=A0A1G7SWI6_9HYPH|nr:LysR family transcriptional regulator [Pelagibacterium luteolum]SDG27308.1 LysR family transcriptional regulator, nitrogen assimilation regulatory protein [Pelagibacterium luteolum]
MTASSLRQIRYFVAVANTGSFTAAAEALHVSQPAVGLQVKFLEDRLGLPLFDRHSRGVDITPAGRAYLKHAEVMLRELEEAELAMASFRGNQPISLRLGITPTIGRTILAHMMHRAAQPDIAMRVDCEEGVSDKLIHMVSVGDLDCAFCYDPAPEQMLAITPLYTEDLCLVGPSSVIGTDKSAIEFSALRGLPLVLSPRPNYLREMIEARARETAVTIAPVVELELIGLKREFLIHYDYCTIAPYGLFLSDIQNGQISCRRVVNPTVSRTMCLALNRKMPAVAVSRLFEMVKPLVSEHIALGDFHWRQQDAENTAKLIA